ncbi:hypothetical protein BCB4_0189 [Bacillus phage B4]|uniref:Uncharacterized protein n=2 Tax=Bequatrovirus B4 TaxID=1918005 RepID=J9PQJ2_9CAUD|nr:hypothetical protein BCB4_0189 [Bacillus phage B4]YP_009783780.1 hypothetical protein QLX26_gp184 [Bacillus phage B5S]AEW47418.1 hypothetical protein B5S_0184 [Bacillus phage B5S]AEZ65982.1 hypothetical protein BCB4_0189 [Bacillus phage B4]
MRIIIDEQPKAPVYQPGDIIVVRSGTYIIYKVPNKEEYHLISANFNSWANGTYHDINDMVNNIKRNNEAFRHYSKDEYELKLVKK